MADSLTQEKVREAVASLQNVVADYDREFAAFGGRSWFRAGEVDCNPAHLRTLLAAYTTAEADMAEARKALRWNRDALQTTDVCLRSWNSNLGSPANVEGAIAEADRILAAFYNKGEE